MRLGSGPYTLPTAHPCTTYAVIENRDQSIRTFKTFGSSSRAAYISSLPTIADDEIVVVWSDADARCIHPFIYERHPEPPGCVAWPTLSAMTKSLLLSYATFSGGLHCDDCNERKLPLHENLTRIDLRCASDSGILVHIVDFRQFVRLIRQAPGTTQRVRIHWR